MPRLMLATLLLAATNGFAQIRSERVIPIEQGRTHLLQTADRAPIVLEGRVVAWRGLWDTRHEMIMTANKVEVYTLFKGQPVFSQRKYVEILTVGGTVGDEGMGVFDGNEVRLPLNAIGLFFLAPYAPDNGFRPVVKGRPYLQAVVGEGSFWRYDGSPWTGADNAAHIPEKGICPDIPIAIHAPLRSTYGRPTILVPGFDAAHFTAYNPFPGGQRSGAPVKKPASKIR